MGIQSQVDPLESYHSFAAKCTTNAEKSLAEYAELHKDTVLSIEVLHAWVDEMNSRPEHFMLTTALQEMRFGVLACAQGQYRQAFMALRMSLELSLAAVVFSVREVDLREWQTGRLDLKWNLLLEEKEGLFSDRFMRACAPGLEDDAKQVKGIALTSYRECSGFVHGSAETATAIPDTLEFDEDLLKKWHAHATLILTPITFALLSRYARYREVVTTEKAKAAVTAHLSGVKTAMGLIGGGAP